MVGKSFAVVFLCGASTWGVSQSVDSLRASALTAAKKVYQQTGRGQSLAQHGIEVAPLPKGTQGSPYLWDDFLTGRLTYKGLVYENVPLQYDVLDDQVLTEHPFGFFPMQYVRSKVTAFEAGGQLFRWVAAPGAPAAFYQILHEGTVTVMARKKKELRERFIDNKIEKTYNPIDQYFLQKDGQLIRVSSRKHLWAVLGPQKATIKRQWQAAGISFDQQKEKALILAATLYE
jgi:hypothetical protein